MNTKLTKSEPNALVGSVLQVRLILRLMGDARVSGWAKLVMVAAIIYWISPIDLVMMPGISWADDAGVMLFASYLFVAMCPAKVVKELSR